jgi:hypothetical protein
VTRTAANASEAPTAARALWRSVAIPTEHGGWGLTLEPVLLGLLLVASWAGAAVGVAAFLAFLVRTPLKLALVDRRRHRSLARTALATKIAAIELIAIVGLASFALVTAGWDWLAPVALAIPLVAVELWFDVRSRSRRLVPELCGAVGIAAVAATIVIAGDGDAMLAGAAWMILAARAFASIPYVRTQIVRTRRATVRLAPTDALQGFAALVAAGALVVDEQVLLGTCAVVVLAAAQSIALRREHIPAVKVIGLRQMAAGLAVVAATAIGATLW